MDNRIKDAFDGISAEDALKRDTKAYLARRMRSAAPRVRRRALMAALACLALVLLAAGGYGLWYLPVSAISVDVNPSIELGINRFGRVVSVEGYNKDGDELAGSVSLKNLDYTEALETLLSSDGMAAYLGKDALVSISVIGYTDAESERMLAKISACGYAGAANVECRCVNRAEAAAAHEAGLSFGKYRAFLELQALDPDITVEDVRGLTMRQLRDMAAKLSGFSDAPAHGCKN